jgi:glycosyltransferase involved in cell wall biosynthesis
MSTRILFLAAQLQPFLVSGIRSLLENYEVEIIVYCRNDNQNLLLDLPSDKRLKVFLYPDEPDTFFWNEIKSFNPQIVFCAGWMYLRYLNWCKALRNYGAKTICAMDTQWKGTLKQKVLTLVAPFTIGKYFSYAWIPGSRQMDYAHRLGFKDDCILKYLYAPDTHLFQQSYSIFKQKQFRTFPKRFLYVGRIEFHKMGNLLTAFCSLSKDELNGWELQLIGDGSMSGNRLVQNPFIQIQKSLPQQQLMEIASYGGVFCLCSSDEPWGTVVQEFSAAGMPLLVSKQCGSSDHFMEGNGIVCDGKDVESIKKALLRFISLSDEQLFEMSAKSHLLGTSTNSDVWAKELMRLA